MEQHPYYFVTAQVFRLKAETNQSPLKDPEFCMVIVFFFSLQPLAFSLIT